MTEEIIYSQFTGEDFTPVIELMKSTYPGHEISDERYLFWEYVRNPDGRVIMNIASNGRQTIAHYAIIPRKFIFHKQQLDGSVSVNTITHPDFRGKNLFSKLASETFRQCHDRRILFTIGFPNPVSLPVIKKKNIFDVTGALTVMFRPLNPVKTLSRYFSGKKDKSGDEIPLSIIISNKDVSLFDITSASESYNKLLLAFNGKGHITTHRNVEFFKWRYIDIPRRTYFSLKHSAGEINAVIVFRAKYIYGIRCLVIVDIIGIKQDAIDQLLQEVNMIAKRNNMDLILTAICQHTEEYHTLKSAGYFSLPQFLLPQKLAFIVKRHHNDCPEEVLYFESWFLTFGDYDIF